MKRPARLKKYTVLLWGVLAIELVVLAAISLRGRSFDVLAPKGVIASKELHLMVVATALMLVVVVPVFILTAWIAWRYREGNTQAKYTPEWDRHRGLEFIWWAFPCAIILVLSVVTWTSSHELDPFKRLDSAKKPLTVQVVALQWKWLFIYPEQRIASVNFLKLPVNTPVNFEITSDAPMNSFWIPRLGGQVYAMAGMSTKLHLEASEVGNYKGLSANMSGPGFAGMNFMTQVSNQGDFDSWAQSLRQSGGPLDEQQYAALAKPSKNNPPAHYSLRQEDLYHEVVMKYMVPGGLQAAEGHL